MSVIGKKAPPRDDGLPFFSERFQKHVVSLLLTVRQAQDLEDLRLFMGKRTKSEVIRTLIEREAEREGAARLRGRLMERMGKR